MSQIAHVLSFLEPFVRKHVIYTLPSKYGITFDTHTRTVKIFVLYILISKVVESKLDYNTL